MTKGRAVSAGAAVGVHLLLAWLLLTAWPPQPAPPLPQPKLALFDVPPPPPPLMVPQAAPAPAPDLPASPAAQPEAAPVIAPEPLVQLDAPPLPAIAAAAQAGAAVTRASAGSGQGGPGWRSGVGSDAGGKARAARLIAGRLSGADFPKRALRRGAGGTVLIRYLVAADGSVGGCTVTSSSGNRLLDEITCRLIEERFRYEPARDALGSPIAETVTGTHIWWTKSRR